MKKLYFSIDRNGACSPAEVYAELENQTDFLSPDCCGGGIGLEDVQRMMEESYITLDADKINVWVTG